MNNSINKQELDKSKNEELLLINQNNDLNKVIQDQHENLNSTQSDLNDLQSR
jgi:hypothetical protein